MTHKQFFANIEGYYGKYPQRPILKHEIAEYIKSIPTEELDGIFAYLIYNVSTQYGFVPDIAIIVDARQSILATHNRETVVRMPTLPDPTARSMKIEVGGFMKKIMEKVRG